MSVGDFSRPSNNFPSASAWLEDLLQEDSLTIYSYFSTCSTNYTTSNLTGPGRLIGNLLSRMGSSLERRLGKLAYRVGIGSYAKAEAMLWRSNALYAMIKVGDMAQKESACEILLRYARSANPTIQIIAFSQIIHHSIRFPSRIRSALLHLSQNRSGFGPIDALTFSWKKPGVEYSPMWLNYYRLAARCVSMEEGAVMEVAAHEQFDRIPSLSLDFAYFEGMLSCCSYVDATDTMLTLEFIIRYWNGEGIDRYAKTNGFTDPVLLRLVHTYIAQYEFAASHTTLSISSKLRWSAKAFISGMWDGLRGLAIEDVDSIAEDDEGMELVSLWKEVFKLYWILQRLQDAPTSWAEQCHHHLPGPQHAKLRNKLLRLEGTDRDPTRD